MSKFLFGLSRLSFQPDFRILATTRLLFGSEKIIMKFYLIYIHYIYFIKPLDRVRRLL